MVYFRLGVTPVVPHNLYRREAIQAIEFAERIDPKWTPRIIALTCLLYLFVVITPAFASGTVEIEIGSASPGDDYVCWAPIEARIRLTEPQAQSKTVVLATTLADVARGSGELAFVDAPPGGLEASQVDPRKEIEIELPQDSSWKSFYVLGTVASSNDKDVSIIVKDESRTEVSTHDLMVRVRKNVETLTPGERDRFLNAFVKAANRNNQFAKYWRIHTDGINLAHQRAFLPWHRVFLANLERELQAEDPSVALPYWEFDKPAPRLFSEDFLGRVDSSTPDSSLVRFSTRNPLSTWGLTDPRVTPLRRNRNGDQAASSAINKRFMRSDQHVVMTTDIFGPYHGQAHVFIGGLIGDFRRSPADPLFFLLHANVDRAWAAWQRLYNRFDKSNSSAYVLQGSHTPGSVFLFGNYVDDTMWPWDSIARPGEPITETIGVISLPDNPGPSRGLTGTPKVGDTLDYLDMGGAGIAHGFCYDSIPYGIGEVDDFWMP